jgi:hypothetical protein
MGRTDHLQAVIFDPGGPVADPLHLCHGAGDEEHGKALPLKVLRLLHTLVLKADVAAGGTSSIR